ncbi:MAG: tRNA pseudouridine synthase A [Cyclobacteriaceae bacterium]
MQTVRLKVNEKVYKHLVWFLSKFSKDEFQIIEESDEYSSIHEELHRELQQIEKGNVEFIDMQHLEDELEATIRKYEA